MNNSGYKRLIDRSRSTVDSDSNWLITLSDVMLLLLVFFVVLLMAKHVETKKTAGAVAAAARTELPATTAGEALRDEMITRIKELGIENDATVRTVNNDIIITLKESITFMPGEAEILQGSAPIIASVAEIIRNNPSCMVEIDGHTDNVPIHTSRFPSNWELSVARATSVLKYFIDVQGMDPSRFYVKGNADQRPVAPNDTPEQRAQNRRVEIRLKNTA